MAKKTAVEGQQISTFCSDKTEQQIDKILETIEENGGYSPSRANLRKVELAKAIQAKYDAIMEAEKTAAKK